MKTLTIDTESPIGGFPLRIALSTGEECYCPVKWAMNNVATMGVSFCPPLEILAVRFVETAQ